MDDPVVGYIQLFTAPFAPADWTFCVEGTYPAKAS